MINIKDVPVYDPKKHYYEQSRRVFQFYQEEFEKIRKGVRIGGWQMHPWLYFHLNVYKTPIPQKDGTDKLSHPPLSDNELLICDSLADAERKNKVLALFGTRGFRKTTFITSHIQWKMFTTSQGVYSILSGSDDDVKSMATLLEKTFSNADPAFFIPTLKKDWKEHIIFGVKDKTPGGRGYTHGEVIITVANENKKNSTEKGAGLSPIGFVIDEFGKQDFYQPLESALPSFRTPYGYRLTPIISGTSGDMEKAKTAKLILTQELEKFDILPFDYDRLSKNVPDEFITWKEDKGKKFGTLVPGQMSSRILVRKIRSNLADFLKINNDTLKSIPLDVTDWEKATKYIKNLHSKMPDGQEVESKRDAMYYPLKIADIFLTKGKNPFPINAINKRIKELEDKGDKGKPIELYAEGSKIRYNFSNKQRAKVPHPGGEADAPAYLYDEFPESTPEKYFYISGLDDYKTDMSFTDSTGAFYVVARRNLAMNSPCEKIVLSYAARPSRHKVFHEQCEYAAEAWMAECFMEAADTTFLMHLEGKQKQWKLLSPSTTFSPSKDKKTGNISNSFGLYPTFYNNQYRMSIFIDWCWEKHIIAFDDTGAPIEKLSVEFIDDIDVLYEMANYHTLKNTDRIAALSHAILKCYLLDQENVMPNTMRKKIDFTKPAQSSQQTGSALGRLVQPKNTSSTKTYSKYGRRL